MSDRQTQLHQQEQHRATVHISDAGRRLYAVPNVGDRRYSAMCPDCNPATMMSNCVHINLVDQHIGPGIRPGMAAVFITGELAGIGMLAAPWAVVNLGWFGFVMILAFGLATVYSSICLGNCWLILEERYVECCWYPCPDPFATIAFRAVGQKTSDLCTFCVNITLFGAATVHLMLIAQLAEKLFTDSHPEISFCTYLFVFSVSLSSLMYFETPKKYCLVAIGALLTAMTACYFVIMQMFLDVRTGEGTNHVVPHANEWDADQFFLSFGTILFSYGGATLFPIIRNDMFIKNHFTHTLISAFIMLTILFGSIVVGGYVVYGDQIQPNVLLSLGDSIFSYVAIVLMIAHLILGFIITSDPITKQLEKLFRAPENVMSFQKFSVRMCLLVGMIFLGQTVRDFSKLVTLIGSSTIILMMFVLPSVFYLRLCAKEDPRWSNRTLSRKYKWSLYTIIVLGLIGGSASLWAAIANIFDIHSSMTPCFWSSMISTKGFIE